MRRTPSAGILQSSFKSAARSNHAAKVVDTTTGQHHAVCLPRSDIDKSISFSLLRCIMSVIGIALALTDIPRTGMSLSLADSYKSAAPDVYMSTGPFAYPSIRINRTAVNGTYRASRRNLPVAAATVWAYKFDTLSISHRAIAEHLQLASYPDCILYRSSCPATTMDLSTAFHMIDDWIAAMQTRHFQPNDHDGDLPFVFMTRSNWLDRLHHVLLKHAWKRQDTRLHAVRFYSADAIHSASRPWTLCGYPVFSIQRRVRRAFICDVYFRWRFTHPSPPLQGPAPQVSLPRHIELRLASLQQQYPALQFDLTMITSRSILSSELYSSRTPMLFYSTENLEITTWIRGRSCSSSGAQCETVLVDDYRYEATALVSNAEDWRVITGTLRAIAQTYIWIRFASLCIGAYRAQFSEPKRRNRTTERRLVGTLVTLSKIPSLVVVYDSWLPVICYSVAHVIDSGITHLISNSVWTSVDGLFQFHFVTYIRSASIQMRNIWMIALAWKIMLFAYTYVNGDSRGTPWVARNGILSMRGISISCVSYLTVFSFLRALHFRDTQVVAFTALARHVPLNGLRYPPNYTNVADFGYRLDVKTVVTATLMVVAFGLVVQLLISQSTKRKTRFFFCRTYYIPHSAGRLWPRAMLYLFWNLGLHKSPQVVEPTKPRPTVGSITLRHLSTTVVQKTMRPPLPNPHVQCSVCNRAQSLLHWKSVQGCVVHDDLYRVDTRPPEVWAMVKLLNIAMLTDPIALARVCLFGQELFVYANKPSGDVGVWGTDAPRTSFLLPPSLDDLEDENAAVSSELELIARVDSTTVAWAALVYCG